MKRILAGAFLLAAFTICLPAQEGKAAPGAPKEESGGMLGWQWANFAILVAGLGYLLSKNLPPYFHARNYEIRKGIAEAAKLKAEAEARAAEVDLKLANLEAEIDKLRADLHLEMTAEGRRIQQETERLIARQQQQAEQEIRFMSKTARHELKAFSAALAIDLAKQDIRERMDSGSQRWLVESFVHDLRDAAGPEVAQ